MLRLMLAVCFVAMTTGQKGQHGQHGQQEDPCEKYVILADQRRSINYTARGDETNACDDKIDESVWYRFLGLPPQRIHDECVPPYKCATDQGIWMSGRHPTADDPGPKTVDVCAVKGTKCCEDWKSSIRVKFCPAAAGDGEAFYVYQLKKPPRCPMSYCSGIGALCLQENTIWNPSRKACTHKHPEAGKPIFAEPVIVKKTRDTEPYDDFYFSCNVQWIDQEKPVQKGEQFEVVFTFDGIQVDSVPPKIVDGSNLNVALWSKEIKGQVGKTIRCKVRSFWKLSPAGITDFQESEFHFFVGIEWSTTSADGPFSSSPIAIDEKDPPLSLYFRPTVPVSCPDVEASCKFSLFMADIDKRDEVAMKDCAITFSGLDIHRQLSSAQMIKAMRTPGTKTRMSVLRFQRIDTNPDFFWHGYQMPDIAITIKDHSKTAVCQSIGDPHITTFDKRYYNVYTEGDYLFAKSTERNFEVHVRHHKFGGTATANCAVAVREGNHVLGVSFCNGPSSYPIPITYLKDENVPGATISLSGNTYTITMPSGAYLRVDYHRNWQNSILDLYLYLNAEDKTKTSGLCGIWNGNPSDDTGSITGDFPVTFTSSQRLKAEDSFINGHVRPIPCLITKDLMPNICTCTEKKAVTCTTPDQKSITLVSKFAEKCFAAKQEPSKDRKERDVDSSNEATEEDDRQDDLVLTEADIPIPTVDEKHGVDLTLLRWPTASQITEEAAKLHCQSKLKASTIYQTCHERMIINEESIVNSCVADAQAIDNLTVASAFIVSNFQKICVHEFEIAAVSDGSVTHSTSEELLTKLVSMICPNQCNGNGNCQNGICVCNSGFAGDDCSVIPGHPPQLSSFRRDVKCDFRSSYCREASIFASNFFYSEKFNCKITEVDRSKQLTLGGFLVSGGEVVCKLPAVYRFTDERAETNGTAEAEVGPAPFYRWDIALTNDGSLYSNSLRMTVYDSKCQEIRPDGTTTQKADTCVIDGRCYRSGEASRLNRCNKCFPNKSSVRWTHDETEKVCPPNAATSLCYTFSVFAAAAILISFFRIGA